MGRKTNSPNETLPKNQALVTLRFPDLRPETENLLHGLKSLAPSLGVTYEELMQQAGYIEETIEHQGYTENLYRDDNGKLVDIITRAKDMYEKDSSWANLAYRVTAANPTDMSEIL